MMQILRKFLVPCSIFSLPLAAAGGLIVPWYANPVSTNVAYDASLVVDSSSADVSAKIDAAWNAVSGAEALAGKTAAAKRMGDTTYFRPKFYVLCTDGDIVEFTMDKTVTTAVWTNVLSSADMAAAAGASGTPTALEVSDDGRLAFLRFGSSAEWRALGYAAPVWRLRIVDSLENDNLLTKGEDAFNAVFKGVGGVAYITDGKWKLRYYLSNMWGDGGIGVNDANAADGFAYLSMCRSEYLDFSSANATLENDEIKNDGSVGGYESLKKGSRSPRIGGMTGNALSACQTCGEPRVLLFSPLQTGVMYRTFKLAGVDELLFRTRDDKPNFLAAMPSCVKRLVVEMPNLAGFTASNGFTTDKGSDLSETDFGDIGMPLVTNVVQCLFNYMKGHGTLSVPGARWVADASDGKGYWSSWFSAFYGSTMDAIELGTAANSFEWLGTNSVWKNSSLVRMTFGGVAGGFRICGDADSQFRECNALRDIVFTGGVPIFDEGVQQVFPDAPERSMVFAHPRGDPAWEAILDGKVARLTMPQITAFERANPDRCIPYGVVDRSVFKTQYDQYVAYADTAPGGGVPAGLHAVVTGCDTARGDSVAISSDASFARYPGCFAEGTEVTLSASAGNGGAFLRWYGDVPKEVCSNATVTLTVTNRDMWVYARVVRPWTLVAGEGGKVTVENDTFKLNCTVQNASAGLLRIGNGTPGETFLTYSAGVLDLGGRITDADGKSWTFDRFSDLDCLGAIPSDVKLDALFTPGTLTSMSRMVGSKAKTTSSAVFVVDEPCITGEYNAWGGFINSAIPGLERLVVSVPSLTSLPARCYFWGLGTSTVARFDWWDMSGIVTLGPAALQTQYVPFKTSDGTNISDQYGDNGAYMARRLGGSGKLSLPSMRVVATDPVYASSLALMADVEEISIGGRSVDTTVTAIGDRAFAGDPKLMRLTLHASPDLQVGENIFADQYANDVNGKRYGLDGHTPDEIHFTGKAVSAAAIANLLAGVDAAEVKPVKIYASRNQSGWGILNPVSWIDRSPSAAEKSQAAEGETVIGVYRGGASAPLGKALVIHRANSWDKPLGLVMVLR